MPVVVVHFLLLHTYTDHSAFHNVLIYIYIYTVDIYEILLTKQRVDKSPNGEKMSRRLEA